MQIQVVGNVPQRAHSTDAGADLVAAHDVVVPVGQVVKVGTGTSVQLPPHTVGLVASRSGHGLKAVGLANGVGVIDAGYTGEIGVLLQNSGKTTFRVKAGDRIAQLVIVPVMYATFEPVDVLPDSERGSNGFGSTNG